MSKRRKKKNLLVQMDDQGRMTRVYDRMRCAFCYDPVPRSYPEIVFTPFTKTILAGETEMLWEFGPPHPPAPSCTDCFSLFVANVPAQLVEDSVGRRRVNGEITPLHDDPAFLAELRDLYLAMRANVAELRTARRGVFR